MSNEGRTPAPGGNPRAGESNPRTVGDNPRTVGDNPRAVESNPLAVGGFPRAETVNPASLESIPRASVLFVGNSLTYRGGGLDNHLALLFPGIRTGRIVKGGATLKQLLPLAQKEILEGGWEVVVLQDDLPETTVDAFLESVASGTALVREGGARPLLLETWPYVRLGWIDAAGITETHLRAAADTGITLVPAGRAWRSAAAELPDTDLLDKDREHPSVAGSWLAACTLAVVMKDGSGSGEAGPGHPRILAFPEGLDIHTAERLLSIADHTVRDYRNWPGSGS